MQVIYPLGDSQGKAETMKLPELEDLNLQLVELDKRLLSLRFAFGTLKKNLSDAFAPIAAVLLPTINRALYAAAGLVKSVGQVIAGLLGVQVAQDKVTKSVKKTTAATKSLMKASLAAFDQLNRLQAKTGSSSTPSLSDTEPLKLFPSGLTQTAQTLLTFLAPLQNIDLEPARWAFERLRDALRSLADVAGGALLEMWNGLLVPLITWVAESLAPAVLEALQAAIELATGIAGIFGDAFQGLLETLKPVAEFLGQVLLAVIGQLRDFFAEATVSITGNGSALQGVFDSLTQLLENFWSFSQPVLEQLLQLFEAAFRAIGDSATIAIENALEAIGYLFYSLTALLNGDWDEFWAGLEEAAYHAANAIIAVMNALLIAISAAVNAIFAALNKMSFDVPNWLPVYGGKKFHFDLKPVTAPQIPYLAQGAVLPANKPFLAVVGDQKHGTNIEAPLTTIQEAMALTMADFTAQNAAGQEATVTVLGQILQAVLGISLGDERLAAAVDRHRARTAVMRGGNGWN